MANPQLENGYTSIANEIMDALIRTPNLGFSNGQILWAILRKTYGYHKKEDKISISQLSKMTGCSRRTVIYTLQNLEAKKIIHIKREKVSNKENETNKITFNKNYNEWVVQEKSSQYDKVLKKRRELYYKNKNLVVQEKFGSARNGNLVVQEKEKECRFLAPTKETITKDIYTKEKEDILSGKSDPIEKANKIDYELFMIEWNKTAKNAFLPIIQSLTDDRKLKIKTRYSKNKKYLELFIEALHKIPNTPFLTGDNERNWRIDFDFLIKNDTNILKIIEGKYDSNKKRDNDGWY